MEYIVNLIMCILGSLENLGTHRGTFSWLQKDTLGSLGENEGPGNGS